MKRWLALGSALLFPLALACSASDPALGYTPAADDASAEGASSADDAASGLPDDEGGATPYLRGALAVQQRGCPTCHQSANPADGVLSGQTTPVPGTGAFGKNLTPDPETGIGAFSDAQLMKMIRDGQDEDGDPLCDVMPIYADVAADEGADILAYLHALAPVHRAIPDGDCSVLADGGDGDALDGGIADAADATAWLDAGQEGGSAKDAGKGSGAHKDGGAAKDAGDSGLCATLAPKDASAACRACTGEPACQANGCYGGYECELTTMKCVAPVPECE